MLNEQLIYLFSQFQTSQTEGQLLNDTFLMREATVLCSNHAFCDQWLWQSWHVLNPANNVVLNEHLFNFSCG